MTESGVPDRPFELHYDPDPAAWLVGPTENRPVDVWLPGATDALAQDFRVTDHEESRQFIGAVLRRFAVDDSVELTERLLRWRSIEEDPMPLWLGAVLRAEGWSLEGVELFLSYEGEDLVEPATQEEIDGSVATVRRSIGYSQGEDSLIAGVRYVADNDDPELLSVMLTATSRPGELIEALDDLDAFARTVHVVRPAA